ncbi:GNAT family N-acetyltransferase [Algiphilus sp.]|uniref:GNAT family N-acetyltransferase n=1 Tax=Algiphilus sp. TaxID=1872431 RepID=UPI003C3E60E2
MIELRPYRGDDAERLVALADNARVSRYLTDLFPHPYTREDAEWWIAHGAREVHSDAWAIEHRGELVGGIGVTVQSGWRRHLAEIGYWLGEPYWGRGLAAEAVRRVTAAIFGNPDIRKIYAPVLGANRASMRVLEKNGYQREGVLREEVFKRGQYHDLHIFATLRTEPPEGE